MILFRKTIQTQNRLCVFYGVICDSSKMLLVRLHTLLDNLRSPTELFINREKDVQMQFFFVSRISRPRKLYYIA